MTTITIILLTAALLTTTIMIAGYARTLAAAESDLDEQRLAIGLEAHRAELVAAYIAGLEERVAMLEGATKRNAFLYVTESLPKVNGVCVLGRVRKYSVN